MGPDVMPCVSRPRPSGTHMPVIPKRGAGQFVAQDLGAVRTHRDRPWLRASASRRWASADRVRSRSRRSAGPHGTVGLQGRWVKAVVIGISSRLKDTSMVDSETGKRTSVGDYPTGEMRSRVRQVIASLLVVGGVACGAHGWIGEAAASPDQPIPPVSDAARAAGLVDVRTVVPDAVIDLRYATPNNFVGMAMYPADARCLVDESMAAGLATAADTLRSRRRRACLLGLLPTARRPGSDV